MTSLASLAEADPDRIAFLFDNGDSRETFGELEQRSRQLAVLLRRLGLESGDCVAVLMGNHERFFDVLWACHRAGLYFTPVNWHLQQEEVRTIVDDCDAKVLIASAEFSEVAARVAPRCPKLGPRLSADGAIPGFQRLDVELPGVPADAPLEHPLEGSIMIYSSGTTGRPKGVRRPLSGLPAGHESAWLGAKLFMGIFGIGENDRYLCPAPLYHAAPLLFASAHTRLGASVAVMRRFDPDLALRIIQDQRVTSSQWVPTHFRRLLALPEVVRRAYDLSSLRVAIHAAAPCPIPLKQAMIDWWGDVIVEYYAGTEGGGTLIRSEEWRKHPGSVGRHWGQGKVWILDEEGREIREPHREGAVYFEAPAKREERFRYYKDDAKTAQTYRENLFTLGDLGYLDEDGYLYLTDRQSNMIISGGVNIYPQETENHLSVHPKVADVAVIGVPHEEMGEEVKAVVIPAPGVRPGPELERELIEYCRQGIAHFKAPRSIDFVDALPRTETGKMAKRVLRERYWQGHATRIV